MRTHIRYRPWRHTENPKRILAIRLQAMGDMVITLPYLESLKSRLPQADLDFLTRREVDDIPRNLDLFGHVFSIGGERNFKKQVLSTVSLLPQLWVRHYDVVIDLQDNPISQWVRKLLRPRSWSEFDRFSPIPAGERTRLTIEALELGPVSCSRKPKLRDPSLGRDLLRTRGWKPEADLMILNPAGCFPTKNWPLGHYVDFARLWLRECTRETQFLVLGVESILDRAQFLKERLSNRLINLAGQTTPAEAFGILQQARLMVSEDSGLMHMGWVSGIPTLALFGASRSSWSAPLGDHPCV